MQFAGINHWGVVAAGLAAFVFGALWYGTLSSAWLSALGKSEQEIPSDDFEEKRQRQEIQPNSGLEPTH